MDEMGKGAGEVDGKVAYVVALVTSGVAEPAEPNAEESGVVCNKLGPDVIREGWPGSIEEGRDDTRVGGDDVAAEGDPSSDEEG